MPEYRILIVGGVYSDFTITAADSTEAASIAFEAHEEKDTFENLTTVKNGQVILEDEGTYGPPALIKLLRTDYTEPQL